MAASATSATFNVTGNVAWTATSDNANFTVSPASGNGAAAVTVTFPANTDTENTVSANITVSTTDNVATNSYTVAITQAKAEGAGTLVVELDANETIAGTAGFPTSSKDAAKEEKDYTFGGYTWGFAASKAYYYSSSTNALLWGQSGAYVLMPAVEGKTLTSMTILTGKHASTSVKVGVYSEDAATVVSGGNAIQLNAQGAEFTWNLSGTAVNTRYQLRVTSSHNAQFQKLTLKYQ